MDLCMRKFGMAKYVENFGDLSEMKGEVMVAWQVKKICKYETTLPTLCLAPEKEVVWLQQSWGQLAL